MHPKDHILSFVDLYEEVQRPEATLLVTELCGGGSLQAMISNASHGMARGQILRVLVQIGDALAYLHRRGLFHADVKPANVLVRRSTVTLLDVVLGDCADVRRTDEVREPQGTELFYSPEMVRHGVHGGPGDDVWALGVSLLGMLAQWPLVESEEVGVARYPEVCHTRACALRVANGGHEIVSLLLRMLAWEKDARTSAGEVVEWAGRELDKDAAYSKVKGDMHVDRGMDMGMGMGIGVELELGLNTSGIKSPPGVEVVEYW